MLTVAIVSENDDYDAEIYRVLLGLLLHRPVVRYPTQRRFTGWPSVRDLSEPYLRDADRHGIRHALFAVDNDGGARCAPEHESTHDVAVQSADPDGCRACWVSAIVPPWWIGNGCKHSIIVPVQTPDTWLLCIRGDAFTAPTPEQQHGRRVLKTRFFGKPTPPAPQRLAMALAEIQKPDALDILRERRSFRHFEAQLANWP